MTTKFEVGQVVFVVRNDNRRSTYNATVTKVGRKWVYINEHQRFDPQTKLIDGGNYQSPGRVYLSRDEYDETVTRANAWRDLRSEVQYLYSAPNHLTTERIQAILAEIKGGAA